jgi:hypothetical protein
MHEHAKLRRTLEKREQNRFNSHQQNRFKKDPMKFGKELFQKRNSGNPEFDEKKCFEYFSELYRDEKRDESVLPMPEMKPVKPPTVLFADRSPSVKEIFGIIRRKSNSSAPGLDGISYVPYKRCPSVLPVLAKIFEKVWTSQEIPSSWASACIQLLPKTEKLSDPADFRPIALTAKDLLWSHRETA